MIKLKYSEKEREWEATCPYCGNVMQMEYIALVDADGKLIDKCTKCNKEFLIEAELYSKNLKMIKSEKYAPLIEGAFIALIVALILSLINFLSFGIKLFYGEGLVNLVTPVILSALIIFVGLWYVNAMGIKIPKDYKKYLYVLAFILLILWFLMVILSSFKG